MIYHRWRSPFSSCILLFAFLTTTAQGTSRTDNTIKIGTGKTKPTLTLDHPREGWSVGRMIRVAGKCSDATSNPITININGSRYFARAIDGAFDRNFPSAQGSNQVAVSCENQGGLRTVSRNVFAAVSAIRLKVILSSDTDGVYTDLHVYEPDGKHVFWAETRSPSGGLFFLNAQNGAFDQPGYGPYLYVHPSPPIGLYKFVANYWPGGARQHTLASFEIIIDEGLATEQRRRIAYPLAKPGENHTMAYVAIRDAGLPPLIYVPDQDPDSNKPAALVTESKKKA